MQYSIALLVLIFSITAFAKTTVNSTADAPNLARVERVIQLSSTDKGRISLVEVDNGGSTDISSLVIPSALVLTYFQDGEMNNVFANFPIANIVSLKKAQLKKNLVGVLVTVKDEQLKETEKLITIDISQLVQDAQNPRITVEEFEDQLLTTSVSIE